MPIIGYTPCFFKGHDAWANTWVVELVAFSAAYGYICLILPPR